MDSTVLLAIFMPFLCAQQSAFCCFANSSLLYLYMIQILPSESSMRSFHVEPQKGINL